MCEKSIMSNRYQNKSCVFDESERSKYNLDGMMPCKKDSLNNQILRVEEYISQLDSAVQRYVYLAYLRSTNIILYVNVVKRNLFALLPVIYTPNIGDICLNNHKLLDVLPTEGLYISMYDIKENKLEKLFNNYIKFHELEEPDILVVTDGSRILGLGDLGVNGIGICIGKGGLYTIAAGISPKKIIPVCLDFGTNNEELKKSPFYLGISEPRLNGAELYNLMDKFMATIKQKWPKSLVHFEDFSLNNCFNILERYKQNYLCFNDDIQGTGIVATSAYLNALKVIKKSPLDCRILFIGSGTAATGIALRIVSSVSAKFREIEPNRFIEQIFMYDINGLLIEKDFITYEDIIDSNYLLEQTTKQNKSVYDLYKTFFSRKEHFFHDLVKSKPSLADLVKTINPTIIIASTSCQGLLTKEVLKSIETPQPVIFILSNPTSKMECTFVDAVAVHPNVVFASGSPQSPLKGYSPSQVNNLYAFPGIGLAVSLSKPKTISDKALNAAVFALQETVSEKDIENKIILPNIQKLESITHNIAVAMMQQLFFEKDGSQKTEQKCSDIINSSKFNLEY